MFSLDRGKYQLCLSEDQLLPHTADRKGGRVQSLTLVIKKDPTKGFMFQVTK